MSGNGGSSIVSSTGSLLGVLVGVTGDRVNYVPSTSIIERFWPAERDGQARPPGGGNVGCQPMHSLGNMVAEAA